MSRPQGETRELTVDLAHDEIESRGRELALAVQCAAESEEGLASWLEQMKRAKKSMVGDVDSKKAEANRLAEVVNTGKEKRDVSCSWLYALAAGYAFLVRDDTQELVTHRKLRDEERQTSLLEESYREPTPEQLTVWLAALPVNEPEELGEGHAGEVGAEDRAVDLGNPEGGLDLTAQDDSELGMGQRHWNGDDDDELTGEEQTRAYEGEMWEDGLEDAGGHEPGDESDVPAGYGVEPAYTLLCSNCEAEFHDPAMVLSECPLCHEGRLLEHQSPDPPLNLNPDLPELAAMPDEQAEKLVRRSREKR